MRKIILDVDTGSDDAVTIMAAILAPSIDVVGICSVSGNKDIEKTTENTLRVVEALKANIPVYQGCKKPLVKTLYKDRFIKGQKVINDKLYDENNNEINIHPDYLDLPKATIKKEKISAVEFYLDYLRNTKEKITLVAVGPLTNLAMAIMIDDKILENVEEIIIMGGGHHITNSTSAAEFNIWYDPEAAIKILKNNIKITFVPLDATHKAYVTKEDCDHFEKHQTISGYFASKLCKQRIIVHNARQPLEVKDAAAVHDALCIAYLIDKEVLKDIRHVHIDIGIRDYAEGQTIIDQRYYTEENNAYFVYDADRKRFIEILNELFKNDKNKIIS